MYYAIRHLTKYRYSDTISETVMEVRTQPRSEGNQRLGAFDLHIVPKARALNYCDFLGNTVHTFNIPGAHRQLTITARALIEVDPLPDLPDAISLGSWSALDALGANGDHWDWLTPSPMTSPTPLLDALEQELNLPDRIADPMTLLREMNEKLYNAFQYTPNSTKVDSPIDDALTARQGVCQDFSHVMLAMVRRRGIPARYVSGYISRRKPSDRSAEDATHAWVEAYLPELGWIGFDPTNNTLVGEGHIRVAVGRDYRDVPPTRGTFKGKAESQLDVAVQVLKMQESTDPEFGTVSLGPAEFTPTPDDPVIEAEMYTRFQQMQQQQQ
ncbi:MAG: transglutaminase family protein [Anaerolineae bacterium]|nr:transglutaminase family protein [Anaerolineae bacterium]